jgi:hypothetical protein
MGTVVWTDDDGNTYSDTPATEADRVSLVTAIDHYMNVTLVSDGGRD